MKKKKVYLSKRKFLGSPEHELAGMRVTVRRYKEYAEGSIGVSDGAFCVRLDVSVGNAKKPEKFTRESFAVIDTMITMLQEARTALQAAHTDAQEWAQQEDGK